MDSIRKTLEDYRDHAQESDFRTIGGGMRQDSRGIWQSGGGLMSDGPGRIFFTSGNGVSPSVRAGSSPGGQLAESDRDFDSVEVLQNGEGSGGGYLEAAAALRLHDGERIFVNKLIYYDDYKWAPHIYRGDIVVFWFPDDPSKSYIKRVIGMEGDDIRIDGGQVYVNGKALDETYVPSEYTDQRSYPDLIVPPHCYFVLGDHRSMSNDSRDFGSVNQGFIYGKAVFGYWPMDKMGRLR